MELSAIPKTIDVKVIKSIVWNIIDTGNGFTVVNTHRKENMKDRDNIEESKGEFKTFEEAEKFLEKQTRIN